MHYLRSVVRQAKMTPTLKHRGLLQVITRYEQNSPASTKPVKIFQLASKRFQTMPVYLEFVVIIWYFDKHVSLNLKVFLFLQTGLFNFVEFMKMLERCGRMLERSGIGKDGGCYT